MEHHDEFSAIEYGGMFDAYQGRVGSSTLRQDVDTFGVSVVAAVLIGSLETYLRELS